MTMTNREALHLARDLFAEGRITAQDKRDVEMFVLDFRMEGPVNREVREFLLSA